MKSYNLCEYKNYKKFFSNKYFKNMKYYLSYYVNDLNVRHNLDGYSVIYNPKFVNKNSMKEFWINGIFYEKEDYWNHPDVIHYQYLKKHPELEGFI